MPALLPFRALRYANPSEHIFVPGQEPDPPLDLGLIVEDTLPCLFLYRQRFNEEVREGVMGILNRAEAIIYPHEETEPDRVVACRDRLLATGIQTSSIWAWCDDLTLPPGTHHALSIKAADRFGCLHQMEAITDPATIAELQHSLDGKPLFLADGHHRYAAGWNLITIQVRNESLRSRQPPPIHELEAAALGGRLLPPKSTDFYPKLGAGLIMARHNS